jgi:hypothetical protein
VNRSNSIQNLAAQTRANPPTIRQFVTWIHMDEGDAREDGRASMTALLRDIYGPFDLATANTLHAEEMLVASGLLASQVDRTTDRHSWQTELGRRVAAALFGPDDPYAIGQFGEAVAKGEV